MQRKSPPRRLPPFRQLAGLPSEAQPPSPPPSEPSPPPAPATESPVTILPAPPPGDASVSSNIDPAAVRDVSGLDAAAGVGASEPPPPGEEPSPADSTAPTPPPVIEFEAWFAMMHAAFGLASAVTRIKTLAFDKALPTAAPAFRALYETACEIPQLNFLVAPSGKWFGRAGAVAAFALPMAQGVQAELRARRGLPPRAAGDASPVDRAATDIPGVPSAAFYASVRGAEAGATQ